MNFLPGHDYHMEQGGLRSVADPVDFLLYETPETEVSGSKYIIANRSLFVSDEGHVVYREPGDSRMED